MSSIIPPIRSFFLDEGGATSIEYALIASLVSVGIIAGLLVFQNGMIDMYDVISTTIDGALG